MASAAQVLRSEFLSIGKALEWGNHYRSLLQNSLQIDAFLESRGYRSALETQSKALTFSQSQNCPKAPIILSLVHPDNCSKASSTRSFSSSDGDLPLLNTLSPTSLA